MLDNSKCILVYGLLEDDIKILDETNYRVIRIHDDMVRMRVLDIINGYKFQTLVKEIPKEKIILFNSLSDDEVYKTINHIRSSISDVILAVVTETSKELEFFKLANHLIEERDWYKKK